MPDLAERVGGGGGGGMEGRLQAVANYMYSLLEILIILNNGEQSFFLNLIY